MLFYNMKGTINILNIYIYNFTFCEIIEASLKFSISERNSSIS